MVVGCGDCSIDLSRHGVGGVSERVEGGWLSGIEIVSSID